jgi:hypothetical protein
MVNVPVWLVAALAGFSVFWFARWVLHIAYLIRRGRLLQRTDAFITAWEAREAAREGADDGK